MLSGSKDPPGKKWKNEALVQVPMTPSTSAQCDRLPISEPMGRRSMPPTLPSITPYTRPKLFTQAAAARPSEPGGCQCFYFLQNISQGTPENNWFSLSKKYYFWIRVSKQQFIKIWKQNHRWAGHQRSWYFLAKIFPISWKYITLEIALLHVALAYSTFRPPKCFCVRHLWDGHEGGHQDRSEMIFEGQ